MSAVVAGASTEGRPQPDGESTGQRIIKQERDSDIKDYAETTMNELLGWYGYDKLDTRGLNLKNLGHQFPTTSSSSSSPTRLEDDVSEDDTGQSASPTAENESVPPSVSGGTAIVCAWCLKMGLKLFTLKTASGETKEFCSEPCFNQCRRAAFKKNRVCNWCRHVRHTVNYVDFQDGDDQLQFCSDKCLNQYKMQIFCKETQAYLQMNPHLQEEAKNAASSKLITPDLWLRDCQESTNGAISHSGDEMQTRPSDKDELEDLSVTSKSEHSALSSQVYIQERDIHKNVSVPVKDNLTDKCNNLASYLSDDKDRNERRKRHQEINKESSRKRQRISSFRNKTNHHPEAPPAHLSSTHSSLSFQNQSSVFPPSATFPLPLRSKSPVLINPPAAHTKSFKPHPGITSSVLHPGLPPPPPLLNNDFYHSSFNPPIFPSQQQQLDAVLRMQAGFAPNSPYTPNFYHESMLPFLRNSAQPNPSTVPHPNTVMLPYPIFVPLPVPIPVPIPITSFLPKDKSVDKSSKEGAFNSQELDNKNKERADSEPTKNSINSTDNEFQSTSSSKTHAPVSFSTNSDNDEPKLLKKTKKR